MLNRRSFIKTGAAGSSATVLTCSLSNAQETPPDSRTNLSGVGGYHYQLPEFRKGSRLLFIGDSITDMKWGRNEKDRNHYLGHSYVYLIASRLGVDIPDSELEFFNRGISGHRLGDLKARWEKDAIDMKPDLLSILVGINDVGKSNGKGIDLEKWESDYRFILENSRKANPDLRVVLLNPFVLECGRFTDQKELWNYWRRETDKLCKITEQLAVDFGAVHIETEKIFDAAASAVSPDHWIWDGVHPLPQGHELIARNWIQKVASSRLS